MAAETRVGVGSWEDDIVETLERMLESHLLHATTKRLDTLLTLHARPYTLKSFSFINTWTMPPNPLMPSSCVRASVA